MYDNLYSSWPIMSRRLAISWLEVGCPYDSRVSCWLAFGVGLTISRRRGILLAAKMIDMSGISRIFCALLARARLDQPFNGSNQVFVSITDDHSNQNPRCAQNPICSFLFATAGVRPPIRRHSYINRHSYIRRHPHIRRSKSLGATGELRS